LGALMLVTLITMFLILSISWVKSLDMNESTKNSFYVVAVLIAVVTVLVSMALEWLNNGI
jgi:hypothetical protein